MLAVVYDQAHAGGLAALAGAAASRNDGHLQITADGHGGGHFICVFGHKHTHWGDLVNGSVGGVTASVCRRKQHFALRFGFQALGQKARHFVAGSGNLFVCVAGCVWESGRSCVHRGLIQQELGVFPHRGCLISRYSVVNFKLVLKIVSKCFSLIFTQQVDTSCKYRVPPQFQIEFCGP